MDTVCISDLSVDTVIGVCEWERRVRQTVVLNLELGTDTRSAAASDAIEDALDYAAVAAEVSTLVRESECRLLEALGERVANHLLEHRGLPWLRLELRKPGAVPGAKSVGIVIERGNRA